MRRASSLRERFARVCYLFHVNVMRCGCSPPFTTRSAPQSPRENLDTLAQAGVDITDERLILRGRANLIRANNSKICASLREECDYRDSDCSSSRHIKLGHWMDCYPLDFVTWSYENDDLCWECFEQLKWHVEGARQSIWDSLPAMFNLPPWEELQKQRGIDLGFMPAKVTAMDEES